MNRLDFLARQAQPAKSRIVLLVLDGLGDIRTAEQPRTALECAATPNLDGLAARSALGRIVPAGTGITPGSGPGHLALFGYDPTTPENDIGRGVLEALGLELKLGPNDIAARGNFATADTDGNLTDRRAGRIPTAECERLCESLQIAVTDLADPTVEIIAGEGHRFVLLLRGTELSAAVADTDPQRLGVPPLPPKAESPAAEETVARLHDILGILEEVLAQEATANRVLLRGFSQLPDLPLLPDLYQLRCGAFAGYPLYRGVASACGMEVIPCGKEFPEIVTTVREYWNRFEFFFLHVKQTDQAGEDGDLDAKVRVIEAVDQNLPELMGLAPDVVAVTGDHSTPAPLRAHSWHPVPLLVHSAVCHFDDQQRFTEETATLGHIGTIPSSDLMALLLANAGRLAKFGA